MAHTEQHYRDAAQGLKGELGSQFGQSNLDAAEVSRIHRIADFQENAELMARDGGSIAGVTQKGVRLARNMQDARSSETKKAKRSMDNVLFLDLLDKHIADLDRRMGEIEQELVSQFGEQWAEQVALEVLDPDVMPQRRDGESMTDYQARVEQALINEMLDAQGNIKPEYKNHPRYGQAAQWAQYRFDRSAASDLRTRLSNPDLSRQEARDIIDTAESTSTLDRLRKAQDGLTNEVGAEAVAVAADDLFDETVDAQPVASEDLAFLSGP